MARETIQYIIPTSLDDIPDGATYKKMSTTEQSKLSGIQAGAQVNPANLAALDSTASTKLAGIEDGATADQTGAEVQTAILALADANRVLIGSEPASGEKKVYGIHINASGNIETNQDTVAVP